MAEGSSPTNYALEIGFAAVAETCFALWDASLHTSGKPDSEQLKLLAERALKLLRTYKNVFPIGQAYLLYYQGWYESLTGKLEAARKTWHKGLEAALKFKLLHEEGLIRLRLGSSLSETPTRKMHVERAIQIFEKMGATHELKLARSEAQ